MPNLSSLVPSHPLLEAPVERRTVCNYNLNSEALISEGFQRT